MTCRLCGGTPAANVAFNGNVGMLVVFRTLTNPGPFCRDCGLRVFRDMTSETLIMGWWSWITIIVNPFTVIGNLRRRNVIARLAPPQRDLAAQSSLPAPLDPGKPVLRRFQSWFGPAILIVVVGALVVGAIAIENRKQVGGCVNGTEFVSCDRPHDGRIVAVVENNDRDCPANADGYLQEGRGAVSKIYCLTQE